MTMREARLRVRGVNGDVLGVQRDGLPQAVLKARDRIAAGPR